MLALGALDTCYSIIEGSRWARLAAAGSLGIVCASWADNACIEPTYTVGIDLALFAGVGPLISIEPWAAVFTL